LLLCCFSCLGIVAARAGKDLISALCSGLLTIGPRFGGALDGAAQQFGSGYDSGLSAEDFMAKMRRDKELIMGIGHKIKVSTHAQASSDLSDVGHACLLLKTDLFSHLVCFCFCSF
jgi:hypothetical protein